MWVISLVFSFCLGILAGYQLPVWLAAWRAYRRRKAFRMTVLQQYTPAIDQQADERSGSRT